MSGTNGLPPGESGRHPRRGPGGRRGITSAIRSLAESAGRVDRRIIFLFIAFAVALPLLFPLNLMVRVSREARAYFDEIERLQPGDAILVSIDYEPDTMAELDPMTLATLRHAFRKDLKVLVLTNYAGGVGIAERMLAETAGPPGKEYGVDYVFLGYNPDYSATILRMGESIRRTFPTDQYRTSTEEIPLLHEVDSYAALDLLISISASALTEYWIIWAGGKYGQRIVAGNTAIQAVLIYPYYQTGQLSGHVEIHQIAGIVPIEIEHARPLVDMAGHLQHLFG